jgi:RimJ/RimL family protein N-acetyltransferase
VEIAFRPLAREDLQQVHVWLQREHVACWWNEEMSPARVEEKYVPRIEGREPVSMFVIVLGGRDAGFVQTYKVGDYAESWPFDVGADAAGMDLAIGEPDLIGCGIGPQVIRAFVDGIVFADPAVAACVADPDVCNSRSVRAFEKAGFTVVGTMEPPGAPAPQAVVRLER